MSKTQIYLNFPGNAEDAFGFYKDIFGGAFIAVMRYRDAPGMEHLSEADKDKIMHISMPLGDNVVLMASDVLESLGQKLTFGNNAYIMHSCDSRQDADRIFSNLTERGVVEMPMADQFWGAYFGSLKDPYGVQWMIEFAANH